LTAAVSRPRGASKAAPPDRSTIRPVYNTAFLRGNASRLAGILCENNFEPDLLEICDQRDLREPPHGAFHERSLWAAPSLLERRLFRGWALVLPVDTTHPLAYGPLHASCLAGKSARAGESELSYTSPFQSRDYYIPSYISLEIDRTWYLGGTSSAFRLPPRLQNGDQLDAVEYSAPHRSYSTVGTHTPWSSHSGHTTRTPL
jgi:hypothetical protein